MKVDESPVGVARLIGIKTLARLAQRFGHPQVVGCNHQLSSSINGTCRRCISGVGSDARV